MTTQRLTVPVSVFVRLGDAPVLELQQVSRLVVDGVTETETYLPVERLNPQALSAESKTLLKRILGETAAGLQGRLMQAEAERDALVEQLRTEQAAHQLTQTRLQEALPEKPVEEANPLLP